ncbi:MAG: ATP-binding protein [Candidatus Melainabacteria bacterium]|nr:ATP-binding protein [Candidatus Melainabacteria bacterium]
MTERNRIIITGASGVGKTTLVESLTPLLSLPVIPELGRRLCREMGYERIGDIPDQEGFKIEVLDAQIKAENELGSFLSDRSTIDCWVLWQRWNICQAMTYTSEDYYRKARGQAGTYTHIVYVPPMFEPVEDGFRWTDRDYQQQIDRLVRTTIYDWGLRDRTCTIESRETAARTEEVLTWLKKGDKNSDTRVGADS